MQLPQALIESVRRGEVILFLGSGASKGAVHPKASVAPTGPQLGTLLCDRFLSTDYYGRPLAEISELAISESDLYTVQDFIASFFVDFYPASFHELIPTFCWIAIFSTNYDLLVERTYQKMAGKCLQELTIFLKDGDRIEAKLRSPGNVPYFKLHGCLTQTNDISIPLILTPDQYITHRRNRERLFSKLYNFAVEYPILFIGQSLSDLDIRTILNDLDTVADSKPRSYLVLPNITPIEARLWESKKITPIACTFQEFIEQLDQSIPKPLRKLAAIGPITMSPIEKHYKVTSGILKDSINTLLTRDVDYVYSSMPLPRIEPKAFYKGYFNSFAPIASNLDVRRSLSESILSEIFLVNEAERSNTEFVVVKGHAGSGKSVLLKRICWDAATEFNCLCLFQKPNSYLQYEHLAELSRVCGERIYLFIDSACEYKDQIDEIITKANRDKLRITIVSSDRYNEWNDQAASLEPLVTSFFELRYLSTNEIKQLLGLLRDNASLGHLASLSDDKQIEELSQHAGRQLLVALHEATLGKPFAEIVLDEYNGISSLKAKSLYLTICVMHRLGVQTRAGLISRVHSIPFSQFKAELFKPLEFIIFTSEDKLIRDFYYRARHQHIAEIVFERVLTNPQDRFDEYMRILNHIDTDYQSDHDALAGLCNAKELLHLFSDPLMVRQFYDRAREKNPENASILQQEAIFEKTRPNGNLVRAEELLQKARSMAPHNKTIIHTLSELSLEKARRSTNRLERSRLLADARTLASTDSFASPDSYRMHTLIKIAFEDLRDATIDNDSRTIEATMKRLEEQMSIANQIFPDDSFILDTEANFALFCKDNPRALILLQSAFAANKQSPYIAIRLAKLLMDQGQTEEATTVLKECVERNPSDKNVRYHLALILMRSDAPLTAEIMHHLRASFTEGDTNFMAQFWYARMLFIENNFGESIELFHKLRNVRVDSRLKRTPRGEIQEQGSQKIFHGSIVYIEFSYIKVRVDGLQVIAFAEKDDLPAATWSGLSYGLRVQLSLAFNFYGPVATSIKKEL